MKAFIHKALENHILDIDHRDYEDIAKIIERKELDKLSFYLESEQEEKFEFFLKELLKNHAIKTAISTLIEKEKLRNSIVKKDISLTKKEGRTCTVFYGTNREPNDVSNHKKGYGNERADKLHLGSCKVNVPYNREKGELSHAYTQHSEQTTLYISTKDKAVGVSKWLHSHSRAGFTPPVCVVDQINTIEVEDNVNLLELGHGYFAGQTKLLEDMQKLITLNLDANNRMETLKLQKATTAHHYWKLKGD